MRLELCGRGGFRLEVDSAVGRDHLGDGVFEGFNTFAGNSGDFVEGELAALRHGCKFFSLSGLATSIFAATRMVGLAASAGSKLLSSSVMTL